MTELHTQRFLRSGGNVAALGIKTFEHPTLPLVGYSYDQIESPKTHPVVKECRGLVLEKDTHAVVLRGFDRFYNAGEDQEAFKTFDWTDFSCSAKEDGSLILTGYYKGDLLVNTRGSFGLMECGFSGKTWREVFFDTIPAPSVWRPGETLLFELCTPHNKVVRSYPTPRLYLIGGRGFFGEEYSDFRLDEIAESMDVLRPERFSFKSEAEIRAFLQERSLTDKTFEGVVIKDSKGLRFKVKSETYLALHHLRGEGNLFHPRRLVPLLLAGEKDEIIAYFPEGKTVIERVEADLTTSYESLEQLWSETQGIENQKDFAIAVKTHPFSSLLFILRKTKLVGGLQTLWRSSADLITKRLYGG